MFDLKDFVLNQWVPALRSGHYKQGKRYLCEGNKYCCLGVACDLLGELKQDSYYLNRRVTKDAEEYTYLEYRVAQKLNMSLIGALNWSGQEHVVALATMNDNGMSFEEIADFLEEQANKYL